MLRILSNSYDFHCHSHYSDGELSPAELIDRAANRGIRQIALTDHDTLAGLEQAHEAARHHQIELIAGTEITTATDFGEVHIVGLGVDPDNASLRALLSQQQLIRLERAEEIDRQLQKVGVDGTLDHIRQDARQVITRSHFAQSLVSLGFAKDAKQAFKRYLGKSGKVSVKGDWADLQSVISTIRMAGGIPVLAHPTRYPLSNRKLGLLLEAFAKAGGLAIEMAYPGVSPNHLAWLERFRETHQLVASGGSDFHFSGRPWCELGRFFALDANKPHVKSML